MRAEILASLLERELNLYEALFRATENEADALHRADIDAMIAVAATKEHLLGTLRLTETERTRLTRELSTALGLEQDDPPLSRLAETVGGPMGQRLMDCRSKLIAVAESIVALNNRTMPLLRHSQQMVRGTLAMVQQMVSPDPVYSARGDYGRHNNAGQLLSGQA